MSKTVHILISETFSRNEFAFVSPVKNTLDDISDLGIRVSFFWRMNDRLTDCDVLIISSDYIKQTGLWANPDTVYSLLSDLSKKVGQLMWADMGDSSGTCQFGVLDHVDKYVKGSLLKNRKLYGQKLYSCRLFSDYYHSQMGIDDFDEGEPHLNIPLSRKDHFEKLELSWNQFYSSYSFTGSYKDSIFRKIKKIPGGLRFRFRDPDPKRANLLNCRFGSSYKRNTIAYQRKRIKELVPPYISTDRVSRKEYYKELSESKFVISPFGWGEICYRDFEAICAGAVLIKPNCEHLETWPNFYEYKKTYLDIDWDFENFPSVIDSLKSMPDDQYLDMARRAQNLYKKLALSPEGKHIFSERFKQLIS